MESGTRKKRTLAERRESDKLRQRRFRAKKREQANLLKLITGEEVEKKPSVSRKTAEEIRETNRIRQQRFRAKRRGEEVEDVRVEAEIDDVDVEAEDVPLADFVAPTEPSEKDRQTEIRREKDRIRKRRERQRKRERVQENGEITLEEMFKMNFPNSEQLDEEMPEDAPSAPESTSGSPEGVDPSEFLAELEKLGMQIGFSSDGSPTLEMKAESPTSSSPAPSEATLQEFVEFMLSEKKPWQRCHTSEERRERERMRKRMYRAKQKFLSTGVLDMQWDPSPIKRTPNDVAEQGITPIPEWTKNLSSEQKLAAHRIYNKRYRERIRVNAATAQSSPKPGSEHIDSPMESEADLSSLPPEIYTEILSIISQCDLSSLVAQNV